MPAMGETGTVSEYQSEGDLVIEWRIPNFFSLSEEDDAGYYSPPFFFGGERWYLRIYPNGWSGRDSSGHVDVFLIKCTSECSIRQSFSLSLKTAKGEKYHEEHGTKDFKVGSDCHAFYRFIQRWELTMKSSDLVPEGVLTVVCTIKGSPCAESESNSASAKICTPVPDSPGCSSDSGNSASGAICTSVSDSAGCSSDSGECCHCKGNFATGSLSSHQRKCMQRPVKCPDCLEVVVLQTWLDEHECHPERPEGEAGASGYCINPYEKKLVQDLKELFLQKEDCDVVIKVKGFEIPAHRAILKVRSPVFASTFRHDMKESATGVVEIGDCEPSIFSDFMSFLYCGDIGMISQENVFSLFTLADKYEVLDLRAKCLDFIKKNITVDTFCETITLSLQHSETELISLSTDFFIANADEILPTVNWQTFVAENPTQSNELFMKFVKSVKHSNT